MTELKDQLSLLGRKTEYKQDYAPEVLEAFDNKHPENDYWVRFNCPEFTSLCPITGQPGTAFAYAIDKLQDRGKFFIFPQEEVYAGQVVGEHSHEKDLVVNVTKSKKLTNTRASGTDDKARLIPPVQFSLEEALEYIKEDEYVEVTPKAMRMRKVILDENERKRANKN